MSAADRQDEIIRLLSDPSTYGPGVEKVERVETHISEVFLAGERALKLKRAVVFPYLDFSTPERRREACEAEVRVNRRTAPDIYKGVLKITRRAGGELAIGGDGPVVDWLVEMRRFDQDTLFDRLARKGALKRAMMEDLADAIAAFHGKAEVRTDGGGNAGAAMILDSNVRCFADWGRDVLDPGDVDSLNRHSQEALAKVANVLDRRRDMGRVRHCHGDLHLRNICLVDGRPTLFDGIEFNMAFATIDVLYDLAFLLMDLDHRGLRRLASIVFNRYLDSTGDGVAEAGGLRVTALFLSMRAAIRAHVDATQAASLEDRDKARSRAEEARDYMRRAIDYLNPTPRRLIAVGGLSGSGKSRLARELAPYLGAAPGARVARTDAIRKRLAGIGLNERLGADGYAREMTERTYRAMCAEAAEALAAGQSAIADAVFADPDERRAIADVARDAGVPFQGLWLEAAPEIMADRIRKRHRNVSDADERVLQKQLTYDLGRMEWRRIDSSGPRVETLKAGLATLGLQG
jgi:aminoglycoside phosphotransferase family enzyme/predicted kinase